MLKVLAKQDNLGNAAVVECGVLAQIPEMMDRWELDVNVQACAMTLVESALTGEHTHSISSGSEQLLIRIERAINRHGHMMEFLVAGIAALHAIATSDSSTRALMCELHLPGRVLNVMNRNPDVNALVRYGSYLITAMTQEAKGLKLVFDLGAMEFAQNSLVALMSPLNPFLDVNLVQALTELLACLLSSPEAREHSKHLALAGSIYQVMKRLRSSQSVLCSCYRVIRQLALEPCSASVLVSSGAMLEIVSSLQNFPGHPKLAKCAFRSFTALLQSTDTPCNAALVHTSALLEAVEGYMSHSDVLRAACATLALLAVPLEPKQMLVDSGVLEMMHKVSTKHMCDPCVLSAAFGVLIELASLGYSTQDALTRVGCTRAIIQAMRKHKHHVELQTRSCVALCTIVRNKHEQNQNFVLKQGGVALVLGAVVQHQLNYQLTSCALHMLSQVMECNTMVCEAAMGMTLLPCVLAATSTHADVAAVQEHACAMLCNAIEAGAEVGSERAEMIRTVQGVFRNHPTDPSVLAQGSRLARSLTLRAHENEAALFAPIAMHLLTRISQSEGAMDEHTQLCVLGAVSALIPKGVLTQEQLMSILPMLFAALDAPGHGDAACHEAAAQVLHESCSMFSELMSSCSWHAVLISAHRVMKYTTSASALAALAQLIATLMRRHPEHQKMVLALGGAGVVLGLIDRWRQDPRVCCACCLALKHLCRDLPEAAVLVATQLAVLNQVLERAADADCIVQACNVLCTVASLASFQRHASEQQSSHLCTALLATMRTFSSDERVQLAGNAVVAALGALGEPLLCMLAEAGAMGLVLSAMRAYEASLEIQVVTAKAISSLASTQSNKLWLSANGAMPLLIAGMRGSLWKNQVQSACMEALVMLFIDCRHNMVLAAGLNVLQPTLWALQAHLDCVPVVYLGCQLMGLMCLLEDLAADMVADDVCLDVLLSAMKQHPSSAQVQQQASLVLALIAKCSPRVKATVGHKSGLELVVTAATAHLSHADASMQLLQTMAELSKRCEHNQKLFMELGAVGITVAVMQVHLASMRVQSAGCVALGALVGCVQSYQLEAHDHGAIPAVLSALKQHSTQVSVIEKCCNALVHLCRDCACASLQASCTGAPELLCESLTHFAHSASTVGAMFAVLQILTCGSSMQATSSFVQSDGLHCVVGALDKHRKQEEVLVQAGGLLCNLTRGQSQIRDKFASLGGVQLLVEVLESAVTTAAKSGLCAALGCLAISESSMQDNTELPKRAIQLIVGAMGTEDGQQDVQCLANCSFALSSFCFAHHSNIKHVTDRNGIAMVLAAMQDHLDHREMQLNGCLFVTASCTAIDSRSFASKLSAVRQLLQAFMSFQGDKQVVRDACRGLSVLLKNHKPNQEAFVEQDGLRLCLQSLSLHGQDIATCIELTRLIHTSLVLSSQHQGEIYNLSACKFLNDLEYQEYFESLTPMCRSNRTIQREVSSILQWMSSAMLDILASLADLAQAPVESTDYLTDMRMRWTPSTPSAWSN